MVDLHGFSPSAVQAFHHGGCQRRQAHSGVPALAATGLGSTGFSPASLPHPTGHAHAVSLSGVGATSNMVRRFQLCKMQPSGAVHISVHPAREVTKEPMPLNPSTVHSLRRVFNQSLSVRDIAQPLVSFDESTPAGRSNRVGSLRPWNARRLAGNGGRIGSTSGHGLGSEFN